MKIMTQTEICIEEELLDEMIDQKDIVVFNDDVNTFDHVIATLMKVCKHTEIQAEQCTWIIHHKGKSQVKRDVYDKLEPMCIALLERGITAEIQ